MNVLWCNGDFRGKIQGHIVLVVANDLDKSEFDCGKEQATALILSVEPADVPEDHFEYDSSIN